MAEIEQAGVLRRWAGFTTKRPWRIIGGWVLVAVLLGVLAGTAGGAFADRFSIPGSESQQALDTLRSEFPAYAGDSAQIVFQSDSDIRTDPAVQQRISTFLDEAAKLPEVTFVASPSIRTPPPSPRTAPSPTPPCSMTSNPLKSIVPVSTGSKLWSMRPEATG